MSVDKKFRCDLCGEYLRKDTVKVIRIGTLEDRPDGAERFDIGPECESRPITDLIARFAEERHGT